MKVSLDDGSARFELTLQVSIDSLSVRKIETQTVQNFGATTVNVTAISGTRTFSVEIPTTGDCKVWAKWFPSPDAEATGVPKSANPLFDDGGHLFVENDDEPVEGISPIGPLDDGFDFVYVRVWSIDSTSGAFSSLSGIAHVFTSSSSSSTSSSSSGSPSSSSSSSGESSSSSSSPSPSSSSSSESSSSSFSPSSSSSSSSQVSSSSSSSSPVSSSSSSSVGQVNPRSKKSR